jgi:hypothetical protein
LSEPSGFRFVSFFAYVASWSSVFGGPLSPAAFSSFVL